VVARGAVDDEESELSFPDKHVAEMQQDVHGHGAESVSSDDFESDSRFFLWGRQQRAILVLC